MSDNKAPNGSTSPKGGAPVKLNRLHSSGKTGGSGSGNGSPTVQRVGSSSSTSPGTKKQYRTKNVNGSLSPRVLHGVNTVPPSSGSPSSSRKTKRMPPSSALPSYPPPMPDMMESPQSSPAALKKGHSLGEIPSYALPSKSIADASPRAHQPIGVNHIAVQSSTSRLSQSLQHMSLDSPSSGPHTLATLQKAVDLVDVRPNEPAPAGSPIVSHFDEDDAPSTPPPSFALPTPPTPGKARPKSHDRASTPPEQSPLLPSTPPTSNRAQDPSKAMSMNQKRPMQRWTSTTSVTRHSVAVGGSSNFRWNAAGVRNSSDGGDLGIAPRVQSGGVSGGASERISAGLSASSDDGAYRSMGISPSPPDSPAMSDKVPSENASLASLALSPRLPRQPLTRTTSEWGGSRASVILGGSPAMGTQRMSRSGHFPRPESSPVLTTATSMMDFSRPKKQKTQELPGHFIGEPRVGDDLELSKTEPSKVPVWLEGPDTEENVMYPKGTGPVSMNRDPYELRCGTLNKLVQRVVMPHEKKQGSPHEKYMLVLFMCYQAFTDPDEMMDKLAEAFAVPEEIAAQAPKYFVEVKRNVCHVARSWLTNHFVDFDVERVDRLFDLADKWRQDPEVEIQARFLQKTVERKKDRGSYKSMFAADSVINKAETPSPIMPKLGKGITRWKGNISKKDDVTMYDLSPLEIARQLTVRDFHIYVEIGPVEMLNLAWSKAKYKHRAPNVIELIERFNSFSVLTATAVCSTQTLKERKKVVMFFLDIAKHLRELNNFNSLMSIISGFNSSAVHRLKHTFEGLPKAYSSLLAELSNELSSEKSYKNLRAATEKVKPPAVPYLGMYLTDLTFVEDGNPAVVGGLINFGKFRMVNDTILQVIQFQNVCYNLKLVPKFQQFIDTRQLLGEDDMYKLSISAEPRGKTKKEILALEAEREKEMKRLYGK
eukprot:TRINITY_DN1798_c0_g3_i1.p1 TRINITY_DN1798_c0_g3~~TRINITY_DN1798_c0_g3_i1.p1  ORF type:complete len:937 (-),score=181.60 TRINITY_DN1798_c0_g3_i1:190-3000(-)